MDEWWDCQQLDELFNKICQAQLENKVVVYPQTLLNRIWEVITKAKNPVNCTETGGLGVKLPIYA